MIYLVTKYLKKYKLDVRNQRSLVQIGWGASDEKEEKFEKSNSKSKLKEERGWTGTCHFYRGCKHRTEEFKPQQKLRN